jgi:hypothetical protein
MQDRQSTGIDLPLKALVWEDTGGGPGIYSAGRFHSALLLLLGLSLFLYVSRTVRPSP